MNHPMLVPHRLLLILLYSQFFWVSACAQNKDQAPNDEQATQGDSTELNQLADAKSPYLRQHADNPVDWHEWGPEALQKAQDENKPLLISIGYAACHWCHVMEHESFMDSSVARMMNKHFIPIKIDREERPDIDQIYMNAAQMLTGRGGWPLNAFALPDGRPFYAGTYFPKKQWLKVLNKMSQAYQNQRGKLEEQAAQLTQGIKSQEVITAGLDSTGTFQPSTYEDIFATWQSQIDYQKGGFSGAPKFPLPVGWEFLLQYHYLTGNPQALEAVEITLDKMARGGIYDQVGGGFARYSTDGRWFAPHFEKMLYDNGQLISLYAHAYKLSQKEEYARVIRETLNFVEREMTSPEGGFYSSLNADSEGEEGKFYVWTQEEITNTLAPKTAEKISDYYNLTTSGNWEEGHNILYRSQSVADYARENDLAPQEWKTNLDEARKKLLAQRSKRVRPSTDDKILTSWNALMMKGYIDAYLALGEESYLQTALKNARFLEKNMLQANGALWRNYKDGEAGIAAFLDDYALLAEAYLKLYQATLDKKWLELSRKLAEYAVAHFQNTESGMFYYTSDQAESLIARKMEISDNVIPASNSVMAHVLYKLGVFYYHKPYLKMARTMLKQVQPDMEEGGPYYANWGRLLGLMAYDPFEVAIMGEQSLAKNLSLQKEYLPTSLFMGGQTENLPLLQQKLVDGQTRIYVCKNRVCKLPVQRVQKALDQLKKGKQASFR